jgi:uncharacterized protein YndB with AHSA1/START domain
MNSKSPSGSGIRGSLRSEAGKGVVRLEGRYNTDVEDVWSAITDRGRLARWYAKVEGNLVPGGTFSIFVESDDWVGTGRVEVCEAPRRLVVTTRESDESWRKGQGVAPYDETLEATLAPDDDSPLDAVAFYGAGWQIHADNLAAYVAGGETVDSQTRWDALVPHYRALAAHIS